MGPDQADLHGRLQRLEEHAGFAERALEQLSAEIAELNARTAALARRVQGLEGRLTTLSQPPDEATPE